MKCTYCGEEYVAGSKYCLGCHMPVEDAFGIIPIEYLQEDLPKETVVEVKQQQEQVQQQTQQKEYMFDLIVPFDKNQVKQEEQEDENEFITLLNIPIKQQQQQVEHQAQQQQVEQQQVQQIQQQEVEQQVQQLQQQQVEQQQTVQQAVVPTVTTTQQQVQQIEQPVEFPRPSTALASNQNTLTVDNKKVKNKDGIKLRRKAIAFVIVLLICGFVTWKFVGNDNQNLQTNNKIAALATGGNTIDFLDYKLTVPEGFIYNIYNGTDYIQNDDFVVMFKEETPLSYSYVMENKDSIIASLTTQGLNVKSFESKRLYGSDYVLILGDKGEDKKEYGYMFGDLGGTTPICATIRSNSSKEFDTKWFSVTAIFFATAKK